MTRTLPASYKRCRAKTANGHGERCKHREVEDGFCQLHVPEYVTKRKLRVKQLREINGDQQRLVDLEERNIKLERKNEELRAEVRLLLKRLDAAEKRVRELLEDVL